MLVNAVAYPVVSHNAVSSSPTSDGGAAAVIVNEHYLAKYPEARKNAVEILAIEMATDLPSTFDTNDCMRIVIRSHSDGDAHEHFRRLDAGWLRYEQTRCRKSVRQSGCQAKRRASHRITR